MVANVIRPNTHVVVNEIVEHALNIVRYHELDGDLATAAFVESVRLLGATIAVPAPPVTAPLGLSLAGRLPPLAG